MRQTIAKVAIGLVALFSGLLGASSSSGARETDTLTYAIYADIKDWDPSAAFSLEVIFLRNVYQTLVRYVPQAGGGWKIEPVLAESWSQSADGLSWQFNLREGVFFHDGEPFNAAAAKASLERTIALGQGAAYIWSGVDRIEAPNSRTLIIHTVEPLPIDLIASAQYGAYLYSPKAGEAGASWFNAGNAAGTGPYRLRQWVKGQQVVLELNEAYWDARPAGAFRRVKLRVVLEPATQAQMIRSGEADIITLAPADLLAAMRRNPELVVRVAPSWANSQFLLNTDKYPTNNLEFRKALVHAWDYTNVVNEIYEGTAEPARGTIPRTMWAYDPDLQVPTFDLERAKAHLVASQIPRKDWKIRASYISSSSEYTYAILYYQALLAKLGIDLQLRPGPWSQIWDEAKKQPSAPHMISMTWWPTYPTPADWLVGLFRTEDPTLFNLSHYSNPQFDRLVDEGRRFEALDRHKAIDLYRQAQSILIDDAPAIFYADIKSRLVHRANLAGVETNPAYAGILFLPLHRKAVGVK